MEHNILAALAAFLLLFGVVSERLHRTIITAPMVFVVFGILVGKSGLGLLHIEVGHHNVALLAELTLALVLFTDATRIDLRLLRAEHDLPERMLSVGMLLTVGAGMFFAWLLFPELSIWEMAVLATILTPTDAALAQVILHAETISIRIRQTLNVESGLNDGIALPLLILFMTLNEFTGTETNALIMFTARQLILGPIVGIALGYLGGRLIDLSDQHNWIDDSYLRLSAVGLALLSFAGAELIGGNGFIAAFVAGLTIGNVARHICDTLYRFAEAEGQLLILLTFVIFGAVMVPDGVADLNFQIILYAMLSLTVVRIIPVAISLIGKGLRWETLFLLGWFGPRGVASIIYALIVVNEGHLEHVELVVTVTVTTIIMSVFVHGVSAYPLAQWYGWRMEPHDEVVEHHEVTEMPIRFRKRGHVPSLALKSKRDITKLS